MSDSSLCEQTEHLFGDYSDLGADVVYCINCGTNTGIGLDGYSIGFNPSARPRVVYVVNGAWVIKEQWDARTSKLGKLFCE